MAERYYYNKGIKNAPIRRRLDRRFVSWVLISACIGTFIASGFVYSAKCHFEAVALGYQTQIRRADVEQESERRRLLEVERARALAPEELEGRAHHIGLRNVEPLKDEATASRKPNPPNQKPAIDKPPVTQEPTDLDPAVIRTVSE